MRPPTRQAHSCRMSGESCRVVVELKAGNAVHQRLQKRLALDQRQGGDITAVEMQKAGSRQQLHPLALDARGHAKAVEFDLMKPLRP